MTDDETLKEDETLKGRLDRIRLDEETHTYYIDGKAWPLSVSGLWGKYFEHFDAEGMVGKKLSQWKKTPSSKYYELIRYAKGIGVDPGEAIKKTWEANGENASSLGTHMHKQIENFILGEPHETESVEMRQFYEWKETFNPTGEEGFWMKPWMAEVSVFCEEAYVAGQIDSLWTDWKGRVWMVDWKRCNPLPYVSRNERVDMYGVDETDPSSLFSSLFVPTSRYYQLCLYLLLVEKRSEEEVGRLLSGMDRSDMERDSLPFRKREMNPLSPKMENFGGKTGSYPCDEVPDTPFGHYCIQQNVYKQILERHYGIKLEGMYLAQFHPRLPRPHSVLVPDLSSIASSILEIRACELAFEQDGRGGGFD